MNNKRFYYRFEPIALDYTSEKDVKRYSKELISLDDLSNQINKLQNAFKCASSERADITINILPDIFGVTELHVYHQIKRKLFSKEIKEQSLCFCFTKYEYEQDTDALYEYKTKNIDEVKEILSDLVTKQTPPNLFAWKRIL